MCSYDLVLPLCVRNMMANTYHPEGMMDNTKGFGTNSKRNCEVATEVVATSSRMNFQKDAKFG